MQKVLAIVGPTAIGKTSLAIKLSKDINAEIISGDSMQIYQEVSIGTAKATPEEQNEVKHYLVDQHSVFDDYSVKNFVDEAKIAVNEISEKGKIPLLAGGTGFYVNALLNSMKLGEKDDEERSIDQKWQIFLDQNGAQSLWNKLKEKDPEAAGKIPVANTRRTLRALSVISRTGQKFSQQQKEIPPRYDYLIIGLNSTRYKIYERINKRVDIMMDQGLLKEAKFVYDNREREHQVLQAIGYKEFFPYFEGKATLNDCVEKLKQSSRRYAKRQLTYFRNKLPVEWFDPLEDEDCYKKILIRVKEWEKNE